MLDINNKILVFSGFRTNQDLVLKACVPLLYQITNGTAYYYLPSITAAPIINNQLNCIYHENVKNDKRLLRTPCPERYHQKSGDEEYLMVAPAANAGTLRRLKRRDDAKSNKYL